MSQKGWKVLKEFGPDERVVSMIQYKEHILVATSQRVFMMKNDTFYPLHFAERDPLDATLKEE
jgi:hypothetical protein